MGVDEAAQRRLLRRRSFSEGVASRMVLRGGCFEYASFEEATSKRKSSSRRWFRGCLCEEVAQRMLFLFRKGFEEFAKMFLRKGCFKEAASKRLHRGRCFEEAVSKRVLRRDRVEEGGRE